MDTGGDRENNLVQEGEKGFITLLGRGESVRWREKRRKKKNLNLVFEIERKIRHPFLTKISKAEEILVALFFYPLLFVTF